MTQPLDHLSLHLFILVCEEGAIAWASETRVHRALGGQQATFRHRGTIRYAAAQAQQARGGTDAGRPGAATKT
ncbi:hypothetical protein AXG94_26400 [Pseudomonas corrugata]|nr:hypothetical protein AXG94_26400 [Pseudomonas corrugata]SDU96599.1 hypothetical protein SAMN04490183_2341 [Pseudomonas corrugata]